MNVIEIVDLHKSYRRLGGSKVHAIDGVNLTVDSPGVYGFLGPNGSGKTTTIRCLLGLIRPSSGSVRLFGQDTTTSLYPVVSRVGALVETPKFFPSFSGKKNLDLLASVAGIAEKSITQSLELVGLTERQSDRFGSYSLGMKQRLAIAATLLGNPDLIVLDEPANGLDPEGIVEVRKLLRLLGEQGKTVFVSSHQLGEVQKSCDHVTIIAKGKTVTKGSVAEIVQRSQTDRQVVTVTDVNAAVHTLQTGGFTVHPGATSNEIIVVSADSEPISKCLAGANIFPKSLTPEQSNLETIFLHLTAGQGQK